MVIEQHRVSKIIVEESSRAVNKTSQNIVTQDNIKITTKKSVFTKTPKWKENLYEMVIISNKCKEKRCDWEIARWTIKNKQDCSIKDHKYILVNKWNWGTNRKNQITYCWAIAKGKPNRSEFTNQNHPNRKKHVQKQHWRTFDFKAKEKTRWNHGHQENEKNQERLGWKVWWNQIFWQSLH